MPPIWVRAPVDESTERFLRQFLITVVASDHNHRFHVLGSAFILRAGHPTALCLTAAHVLSFAADVQRPWERSVVLDDFQTGLPRLIDLDRARLRGVWVDGEGLPHMLVIPSAWMAAEGDISYFMASFQDETTRFPSNWGVAVDWRPPNVGEELAAFGFTAQAIDYGSIDGQEARFTMSRELDLRRGEVFDVDFGPGRLRQGPSFGMTTPFPPGMSGSPVINIPREGSPVVLRGIVSSDFSVEEAHQDCTVAGCGTAVMIFPSLGIRLPSAVIDGSAQEDVTIADLLRMGAVEDASGEIDRVQVERTGNGATVRLH